jgi:glycosyltransferase involved in cell wall biosynthesis
VSLNGCDASLISFMPGMAGVSVPSRMYNVLAAGKPILAVADDGSELEMLVREHGVGWVVRPDDVDGLVRTVESLLDRRQDLPAIGGRARALAERECRLETVVDRYADLVRELQDG